MNIPKQNNSDMLDSGWWDILPKHYIKWIRLGRFDRPVGFWLLLLPGWWVLPLTNLDLINCIKLMFVFLIGSIVMRAAGCTINDMWDKDIDKKISRTKTRPLASGEISILHATYFLITMLLIGLICLYQLNIKTWFVAVSAIPLVILYPLAKRFTKWPQIILGLTFSWAVPTAWSAANEEWNLGIFIMYLATVFWIIGYDTIYGYQDIKDDEIIGLKSTSIKFKSNPKKFLFINYSSLFILFLIGGTFMEFNYLYYLLSIIPLFHLFFFQIKIFNFSDPSSCLKAFKSNNLFGLIIFLNILIVKNI